MTAATEDSLPAAALQAWRQLLGVEGVLEGAQAQQVYGADCSGCARSLRGALRLTHAAQVQAVVRIAHAHGVALQPISTGRNWGYGTALPASGASVVLDLRALQSIVDFDEAFGIVTLEPGVTQQQLDAFLRGEVDGRRRPFMVPTTGAGPDASLMGNALERGYGITPHADHFAAVTDIEVVLPDGTLYRTALHELAGEDLARLHKWGIGPYTAGLFSQSGVGIVTRMSIVLARQPECMRVMLFGLAADALLEPAVDAVQRILADFPSTVGGINLMNRHRVLSMTVPYPFDRVPVGATMPAALVQELGRQFQVLPWTGFGTLYGREAVVRAAQREIRRALKGVASRLLFVSPPWSRRLERLAGFVPGPLGERARKMSATLSQAMSIAGGQPSRATFGLAFWLLRHRPAHAASTDPARDGAGLAWYAPLVPMRALQVRQAVDMIQRCTVEHGIEPLVTLTSLNERLFDCTVPILFDPAEPAATQRARRCLAQMVDAGQEIGVFPYRVDIDTMATLRARAPATCALVQALGQGLHHRGLISPGRYFHTGAQLG